MWQALGVPIGLAVAIRCEAIREGDSAAKRESERHRSTAVSDQRAAPSRLGQLSMIREVVGTFASQPTWRVHDFMGLAPDHSQDYKEVAMKANPTRYREGLMSTLEILILAQARV